ncbi:MAG: PorT family protein, partial [Capnocytophaga sp.]
MKKYIFFLVSLITPTISWAQVTVGVRFNNPLLYVSSISHLHDREGEELGSNV